MSRGGVGEALRVGRRERRRGSLEELRVGRRERGRGSLEELRVGRGKSGKVEKGRNEGVGVLPSEC